MSKELKNLTFLSNEVGLVKGIVDCTLEMLDYNKWPVCLLDSEKSELYNLLYKDMFAAIISLDRFQFQVSINIDSEGERFVIPDKTFIDISYKEKLFLQIDALSSIIDIVKFDKSFCINERLGYSKIENWTSPKNWRDLLLYLILQVEPQGDKSKTSEFIFEENLELV